MTVPAKPLQLHRQPWRKLGSSIAAVLLTALTSLVLEKPAFSAPKDRLDRIILLMAVNLSGSAAPLPAPGSSQLVLYGAVSAEAAVAAMKDLIQPLGPEQAKSIRFAPVSYRYLINSGNKAGNDSKGIKILLLPDPGQINRAEALYLKQGLTTRQASELARGQPTVFCPEPAMYALITSGNNKGKRIIPCSFDHQNLDTLISQNHTANKSQTTKIAAIPWQSFASLLSSGTQSYLDDIEVLLSPGTQKAIQKTREDRQFLQRD